MGAGGKDVHGLPRNDGNSDDCSANNGNASDGFDRRNERTGYGLRCLHDFVHRNNEMINLIAKYFLRFLHELTVSSGFQSNAGSYEDNLYGYCIPWF
jgi:hypothetical protein